MEISSKEDFKVAFDKIPDYKIRKEKVSPVFEKLAFSLERKNCECISHFLITSKDGLILTQTI